MSQAIYVATGFAKLGRHITKDSVIRNRDNNSYERLQGIA